MKIISHILFFLCFSTVVLAQSYDALWKQYRQYADKDLPKSALTVLEKIEAKAGKEKSYGNMLAALLREVNHQEEISSDSGKVYRERLDKRIAASGDGVMKTLYRMAKGDRVDVDSLLKSPDSAIYRQKDASLQWLPFMEKGKDSRIFSNDLLHVILMSQYSNEKLDTIYGPDNEYVRYNRIHNEQVRTEPFFSASVEKRIVSSATDIRVIFSQIRNLKALECEVSRVGTKEKRNFTLTLPAHEATKTFSDTLRIGTLPVGRWVVKISDTERKTQSRQDTITVSDTRLLQLSLPKKQKRYVFVNAITGEETTPDSSLIDRRYWNAYTYISNEGYRQYTDIYTDRAIYRPGQKIEAAIIRSAVTDGIETSVVAGEKVHIRLLDSKGETVAEKYAVTDAYGTAAVDFTLPEGDIRSGYWHLSTKGADESFRVEEYKRPTFEVKLKPSKDTYHVGDTAVVSGIAENYNGVAVMNGRVIARWNDVTDTLFTDNEGKFQIVVPIPDRQSPTAKGKRPIAIYPWWRYIRVTADVTDSKGETQSATCHLSISYTPPKEETEEKPVVKPKDTTKYHIYYSVFAGNKVLENSKTYADTASFKNSFAYKEEYGDGAMVCFAWCKDDEIHYDRLILRRPLPSNKLIVEWGTFRNKVAPGAKEVWTLKVHPEEKNSQFSIFNFQLTSVLYDASLDALSRHSWQTYDRRRLAIPSSSWFTPSIGGLWIYGNAKDWVKWRHFDFTHINDECLIRRFHFMGGRAMPMLMANSSDAIGAIGASAKSMRIGVLPKAAESVTMAQDEATEEAVPARTNFGETAFFRPQVETNDKGEATLEFTLPESLTSWRFIGLAHDKAMRSGIIDTTVIAQKQLMVQPNMPRFLRIGDKATVTANVTNMSDKAMKVKVIMTAKGQTTKSIRLSAGETLPVTFSLPVPKDTASIVCSITAKGDQYSDGESQLIPVLPVEQKLDDAITVYKSPDDLMMEDLPALSVPKSKCAISLSNALYANVLTAHLRDTLVSPANDNVMMQLLNLQRSDGSFAWYPGMEGNKYMTMAVLKTLVRMRKMTGGKGMHTALASAVDKGFDYMLKAMDKEVTDMKKYKTTWLSNTALDWLYALAIDGEAKGRKSATYKYLLRLVEDDTNKADMATKAVAAIVMATNGKQPTANTFAESIKQHTVYREDMGRYFDSYRTHYSWCDYRIPSQVMAIEALYAITPEDNCTITQMQRWLVSAKRTQKWDNPVNTVNAVSAFYLKTKPCEEETVKMYRQPSAEELENIIKVKREIIPQSKPGGQQPMANGDIVTVRITIEADRDYDFVSVTDNRAACLEPVHQLSGYRYGYYQQMKDDRTEYFFNQLSKGTHVIETKYYVTRAGEYSTGTTTAVCTYAPYYRGTTPAIIMNYEL